MREMDAQFQPDLTVIIVNWNTRELLLNCIESFYRTVKGHTYEITVVDNGSSNGSVDSMRSTFPEIELIQNNRKLGFARANNEALRRKKGRYALLLNTDIVLSVHGLSKREAEKEGGHRHSACLLPPKAVSGRNGVGGRVDGGWRQGVRPLSKMSSVPSWLEIQPGSWAMLDGFAFRGDWLWKWKFHLST